MKSKPLESPEQDPIENEKVAIDPAEKNLARDGEFFNEYKFGEEKITHTHRFYDNIFECWRYGSVVLSKGRYALFVTTDVLDETNVDLTEEEQIARDVDFEISGGLAFQRYKKAIVPVERICRNMDIIDSYGKIIYEHEALFVDNQDGTFTFWGSVGFNKETNEPWFYVHPERRKQGGKTICFPKRIIDLFRNTYLLTFKGKTRRIINPYYVQNEYIRKAIEEEKEEPAKKKDLPELAF